MPIYEFKCLKCKEYFEKLILKSNQTISCPQCHSEDVEKMMSTCGFKMKKNSGQLGQSSTSASSCASCTSRNCSQCH